MKKEKRLSFIVGTYAKQDSPGIHWVHFDPEAGHFSVETAVAGVQNPSFLALNRSRTRLYAVSETAQGQVVSFAMDSEVCRLEKLNERATMGGAACHLMLDPSDSVLLVANYSGGNVNAFPIGDNGELGEMAANLQHEGSSIRADRQEKAHPHSTVVDPSGRYVMVPDLGIDQIVVYALEKHPAGLREHARVTLEPGAGPRHLTFHPELPLAYVINELNSTINVLSWDSDQGELAVKQTIATLPPDWQGKSTCADIHMTPEGRYLYGSNRGHDSLAMYRVDPVKGTLESIGFESTRGKTPRNFCITPDGGYAIAANQDSDHLAAFKIESDGTLTLIAEHIGIAKPVCLKVI